MREETESKGQKLPTGVKETLERTHTYFFEQLEGSKKKFLTKLDFRTYIA